MTCKPVNIAEDWKRGCADLARSDGVIAALMARYPGEMLEPHGDLFATLARAVVGQQISVMAAESIWTRVLALLGSATPQQVVGVGSEALLACGLTQKKAAYLTGLADHVSGNPAWWATLPTLDDDMLLRELVSLHGIGPWTAHMALIFALGRLDILPAADIGLQRTASEIYGNPRSARALTQLGERWRPWRTIAVWYLWRDLDPVPVVY